MKQIDIERERWARLDFMAGLSGDPLRYFPACMACGLHGPRVVLWMRLGLSEADCKKLPREEQLRLASTWVCADGCDPDRLRQEREQQEREAA